VGRFVIAAFRPKAGQAQALQAVVAKHWHVLRDQGLVTEREPFVMKAADGTLLEVFEWRSAQAIEQAHSNPAVLALWSAFEAACDYVPLASVAEAQHLFAEFEPLTR